MKKNTAKKLVTLTYYALLTGFFTAGCAHAYTTKTKDTSSPSPVPAINYVGNTIQYTAKYEDTFVHLARQHDLGYMDMIAANPGVDPWIPGSGTKLIIPARHILPDAPHKGIVINLPEMRLYAYTNENGIPSTFPVGPGREGLRTPTGTTTIVRKTDGPIWRPTPRMRKEKPELPEVVFPGPENPMGTHALYLGWNEYAIHGTNRPFAIGMPVSSGCIRMYPEDIKVVFRMIPVGTVVTVINQPIKVAWIDNELYLEAHPDLEQIPHPDKSAFLAPAKKPGDDDIQRIVNAAGHYADRLNWPKIRTILRERRGYPIRIARADGTADTQNKTPASSAAHANIQPHAAKSAEKDGQEGDPKSEGQKSTAQKEQWKKPG